MMESPIKRKLFSATRACAEALSKMEHMIKAEKEGRGRGREERGAMGVEGRRKCVGKVLKCVIGSNGVWV